MCLKNYYSTLKDIVNKVDEANIQRYEYTHEENVQERKNQGWGSKAATDFNELKKKSNKHERQAIPMRQRQNSGKSDRENTRS